MRPNRIDLRAKLWPPPPPPPPVEWSRARTHLATVGSKLKERHSSGRQKEEEFNYEKPALRAEAAAAFP